ncbi:PepSY domain-containing protein, partial [Cribrihabitans sp. XS_ASV171]
MKRQPIPASTAPEGGAHASHGAQEMAPAQPDSALLATLDAVVTTVERLAIVPGYAINVPTTPTGVFTASVYPDDITYERVIHLD